jgi:nucleotide-binding universal stress UspA family protein
VPGAKHEEQVSRESSQTLNDARRYLERVAADLRSQTLSVEIVARSGDPSTELLDLSETLSADLIVMATHGRSGFGRWIYGSVADELLRHATRPVMLAPSGTLPPWPAQRAPKLLVTLDGSPLSEAILQAIPQLAALHQSEVVLLHVYEWPPSTTLVYDGGYCDLDPERDLEPCRTYLSEVAERLRPSVTSIVQRVELGRIPLQILEAAREERADLIAMATHGRSGLGRLVLGSTATGVVQRAETPVLLIRPAAMKQTAVPGEQPPSAEMLTVRLTRPELVLVQRGLNALLYKPTAENGKQAVIEQLRDRCRQLEAADMLPAPGQAARDAPE